MSVSYPLSPQLSYRRQSCLLKVTNLVAIFRGLIMAERFNAYGAIRYVINYAVVRNKMLLAL